MDRLWKWRHYKRGGWFLSLSMAEPRHSHVLITLPTQSPSPVPPPFLLTQDIA